MCEDTDVRIFENKIYGAKMEQKLRASALHAGGCGFKSRGVHKLLKKKFYQEAEGNFGYKPADGSECNCGFKAVSNQRSRIPKYGSLNKGFTEQELVRFFNVIDNEKFRLLFSYQSQLGLRIGEAVRINSDTLPPVSLLNSYPQAFVRDTNLMRGINGNP